MSDDVHKEAIIFIKKNKKKLIEQFANDAICSPESNPISIFMAGSPGAGKTEFSKNFLKKIDSKIIRIDADEIKDFIPQYNKKNSSRVQGASALGVEYLFDYVLKAKKSMILDGTFADYEKSCENIERSLKRHRFTEIYYLYQEPLIAWQFTKAREELEGRIVPKTIFVDSLFKAKENAQRVKQRFGSNVKLNVVIRNYKNSLDDTYLDVDGIDRYLKLDYDEESLMKII